MKLLRKWRVEFLVAGRNEEALLEALDDPRYRRSDGMAVRIINALGRFGDCGAVGPILSVLREGRRATVRSTAAIALGRIGGPKAVLALRELLDDEDRPTKMWAMRSVGQLRDRESVGRLIKALAGDDGGIRQYAAKALGEIGDQAATPALIRALSDHKPSVRELAARSLAELGDSRALEPVRRAHSEARGFTRRRIGRALGELETRFG
ncbi:MAG TPA: HEAT repeat domain-containing protein [Solirubrobacterales bacterium]|jgi:HEAT repeat protein